MYSSYQFLYNSILGDASTGLQAVSIFFPFIISVIFLNMLIAIMGDTFDKIQEKRSYSDNIERVQMLLEVVLLVRKWIKLKKFFKNLFHWIKFRKVNKSRFLHQNRRNKLMKKIALRKKKEEAARKQQDKVSLKAIKAPKGSAQHALLQEKKQSSSALQMLNDFKNYTSSKLKKVFRRKREHVVKKEKSRNIIKELRYSAKYELFEHEPIYLVKCKLQEDEDEDEWEGKLRYLQRKNNEAVQESKKKVVASVTKQLGSLTAATGIDKITQMEEKLAAANEKMLTMKDQMAKLVQLFESQNGPGKNILTK